MRVRFMGSIVALLTVLTLPPVGFAAQQSGTQTFDPRDLSGFWDMSNRTAGALNSVGSDRPPMTDWGKTKFSTVKTGHDGKHLGAGLYPNQKDWNDPLLTCEPPGFPRILWEPSSPLMRFVQTREEVIQFFERDRVWRDIWTDGRKLSEDAEPRWYGYAVGRWEGDTFVVESTSFDDRSWLDQYGSPHSDQLRVVERYRRVDRDHLELTVTVNDPKTYTRPWMGDKKTFLRVERPAQSGFNDLRENICTWSEELKNQFR